MVVRQDNAPRANEGIVNASQRPEDISFPCRYRYRTCALLGRWQNTHEEAVADAIRAGQVDRVESQPDLCRWRIEGRIERSNERRSWLRH